MYHPGVVSAKQKVMNKTPTYNRRFLAAVVFAASLAACFKENDNKIPAATEIAASEQLVIPATVSVPANGPSGNTRTATFYATGVQKYKAKEKAGSFPVTYEWSFAGPEADLYNAGNAKVGTHGTGPYWALNTADSIFAQAFTPAKTAPSPDATSIDWLLLMPKDGTTPKGIFADVDYIQRIATKGGKVPASAPITINDVANVYYTAVYRFTKKN